MKSEPIAMVGDWIDTIPLGVVIIKSIIRNKGIMYKVHSPQMGAYFYVRKALIKKVLSESDIESYQRREKDRLEIENKLKQKEEKKQQNKKKTLNIVIR